MQTGDVPVAGFGVLELREHGGNVKNHARGKDQPRENAEYRNGALFFPRQTYRLVGTEIERGAEIVRGDQQNDGFGDHIGGVVGERIDQRVGGGDREPRPHGGAGDHVAGVAQQAHEQRAAHQRGRLVFERPAEYAAEPENEKRDDIIQQDHREYGLPRAHVAQRVQTEQLLDHAENKA